MNNQELIEKYLRMVKLKDIIKRINEVEPPAKQYWIDEILKELGSDYGGVRYLSGYEMGKFEGKVEHMVEIEKVKVPQFVADWIERSKQEKRNLRNALNNGGEKMRLWFLDQENYDLFARAWLDGYEVEEEKRYFVKITAAEQYLVRVEDENFLGFLQSRLRSKFTRKQLEDAGFGWVFDCPGIEIEEVEN